MNIKIKSMGQEKIKIRESKVIVENGEVKTVFSDKINSTGWMTVDEMKRLLLQSMNKRKELSLKNGSLGQQISI
jgi:hypothetical protein